MSLNDINVQLRNAVGLLVDAARDAALEPDLRPIAKLLREAASAPLRNANDSLRRAATDDKAARAAALSEAVNSLGDAAVRIDRLVTLNHRFAQARLDRKRVGLLAAEQDALAKAATSTPPEELTLRQSELLARLQTLIAESEPLRVAGNEVRLREFRRLGATAGEIATRLRNLDAATKQNGVNARHAVITSLSTTQVKLVAQATTVLAQIETAARIAGIDSPSALSSFVFPI